MYAFMNDVYVNEKCNRQCANCYYPHSDVQMSIKQAEKTANWITNIYHVDNVKEFRVHFLGGEPFLNIPAVFAIVDKINKDKPATTIPAGYKGREGFVIFTNGDFIDDTTLKELKKRQIIIMLNPTYDSLKEIEEKILTIKSTCGGCNLAIALNWLNLERLTELTKIAIKYNSNMRINRLYNGGTIPGYVNMYEKQMTKMFKLLLDAERPMWPNFIMESTYPTWTGTKNPNSCGKWFMVIDPDGRLRSCNGDLDTIVGNIDTIKKRSEFKFHQRWSAKNLPECQECEWIMWCQGGCPYTRKLAYGTYNKRSPFCSAFKKLWSLQMELVEKYNKSLK